VDLIDSRRGSHDGLHRGTAAEELLHFGGGHADFQKRANAARRRI
jgi:hypothetical protein